MANSAEKQPAAEIRDRRRLWGPLVPLGAMVIAGVLSISLDAPPAPPKGQVRATEFSAERALQHVKAISQAPHPVGSLEHAAVRNYIVSVLTEMELSPEVQTAKTIHPRLGAITLENIVGRLKGRGGDKAVLLVAHYDSVSNGPGAGDDGAGVGTLLETARALKSRPQTVRDVLFLFTDGEEPGLLGARAFVGENRLADNIGLVLNFEARGSRGPVILFETSDENAWLISQASQAASHPVANSLSYEIYKRLPNDTDFTVFKCAGYPGLNFAFIDGFSHYHTATDTVANLDLGSLQHEGDYAVELGEWFGNVKELRPSEGRAVYFDILGRVLVHYSPFTASLLVLGSGVTLGWVFFRGFRERNLALIPLLASVLLAAGGVIIAIAMPLALQRLAGMLLTSFPQIRATMVGHAGASVISFAVLALAANAVLYAGAVRRFGPVNVAGAGLLVWFVLALAATFWLPGTSYLWIWPLSFTVLAWAAVLRAGTGVGSELLLAGSAIASVLLVAPLAHKVFTAFGLGSSIPVNVLLALLVALCWVQAGPAHAQRAFLLPTAVLASRHGLQVPATESKTTS